MCTPEVSHALARPSLRPRPPPLRRYYAHKGSFASTCNALQLSKGLRQRMWPDSQQQCRQLPNVGRLIAQRLAAAGVGGLRCAPWSDKSKRHA